MERVNRESQPAYAAFPNGTGAGRAYNQAAFRHFLAIERRRAECSNRPILLVLVSLRSVNGRGRLPEATAATILSGLSESVREVDFVGWFREGRVAGAVLAEASTVATGRARQLMAERVRSILGMRLAARQSGSLRVRIVQLPGPTMQQTETAAISG